MSVTIPSGKKIFFSQGQIRSIHTRMYLVFTNFCAKKSMRWKVAKGSSKNYVDMILAFFDHLPTSGWHFVRIFSNFYEVRLAFCWVSSHRLPTSSCQHSFWMTPKPTSSHDSLSRGEVSLSYGWCKIFSSVIYLLLSYSKKLQNILKHRWRHTDDLFQWKANSQLWTQGSPLSTLQRKLCQ